MVFPRGCIYTNTLIICNGAHTTQHSADSGQLYMGYFTTNGSRTSTLFSQSPKKYVRAFIKFNQHGWIWSEKHINPQGIKTLLFDTGEKIGRTKNPSFHIGMADYLQIHFDKGYFMSSSNSFDPVGSIYDNIDPYTYVIRP